MDLPDNLRSLGDLRSRYGGVSADAPVLQGEALGARVIYVLPSPSSQTTSPVDFRDTSRLIDQGHQLTARWLASQRADRSASPDLPVLRIAGAS
jgi:hypothetical protein